MSISKDEVFEAAVNLSPIDRAQLVEVVLSSFSFKHRIDIDEAWVSESEDRIDAFERGEIKSTPMNKVFGQINSTV